LNWKAGFDGWIASIPPDVRQANEIESETN
jgi:hypothetical protein